MDIVHTQTNRGKPAIIVDGFLYRRLSILKNGDIVRICSSDKKCTKSLTTDADGRAITKTRNEHSCGKEPNSREGTLYYFLIEGNYKIILLDISKKQQLRALILNVNCSIFMNSCEELSF